MVAEVLVELAAKQIDQTFSYSIPKQLLDDVEVGKRVLVPFGTRKLEGFVLNVHEKTEDFELKDIIEVIDDYTILDEELLSLGKYISKKTMTNLITSYQTMLPSALKAKHGFVVPKKTISYIRVVDKKYIPKNKLQKEILDMCVSDNVEKKELQSISSSSLQTLIKNKVVEEYKEEAYRINTLDCEYNDKKKLNDEQEKALKEVLKNKDKFAPYLLYGVTGSGKTEVYMQLIEQILLDKKTAIVLVPEISLTPQLVDIFHRRFGSSIAVLHSRLSNGERYDEWRKIKAGEVSIVIGARSAIFAPLKNIGIIVVDEEHTTTYKQENNPKYNAIDIAIKRAKHHLCPLVLGSATPSIEAFTRVQSNIYKLLKLTKRINDNLPEVELVDMKDNLKQGYKIISKRLQNVLTTCFDAGEQAIILLNRRGYSTTVSCHSCGYKVICPSCDIPLTYHKKSNSMKCHYCFHTTYKPNACPECSSKEINQFGLGTEKLEEEIKNLFPQIKTVRMDIDTTTKKGSHEKIIFDFKEKKYQVLIGTQMISKGLDFEDVTVVGVINGDASLNFPDFRSSERTYSLLNQVAGRAGRREKKGTVIIQGFNLTHYSILCASTHDYEEYYKQEMEVRKILKYPPYYNLAIIKLIGKSFDECHEEAEKVLAHLNQNNKSNVILLGPSSDIMPKVNNKYYIQITIKYKNTEDILPCLNFLNDKYRRNKDIIFDIDLSI